MLASDKIRHMFRWLTRLQPPARATSPAKAMSLALSVLCALPALGGCANLRVTYGGQEASIPQPIVNSKIYNNDVTLDEGPVVGGSLRLYATRPDTMNPLLTRNVYTQAMLGLVYGSLVRIGDGLGAEPGLAESWTMSEDGLMWAFDIGQGQSWHDGEPLTALDAADTIQRIKDYGGKCPYAGLVENIASWSTHGDGKLVLTLKKPNAYTPETMVFPIVPAHIDIGALDYADAQANVEAHLVGCGPFRCASYRMDDYLELEPAAAGLGGGVPPSAAEGAAAATGAAAAEPPYLGSIRFVFHGAADMALAAYRADEVDAFFSRAVDYGLYRHSAQMQLAQYSEREFYFVAFDCGSGGVPRNVRNALARLVDREAVVAALGGSAIAAEFPVQPEDALYEQGIPQTPHDPQAARLLLEGAGYTVDRGRYFDMSGGKGELMEIGLLANADNEAQARAAKAVVDSLDKNGVYARLDLLPQDEYSAKLAGGAFEMALCSYRTRSHPDMTEMYAGTPYFGGGARANVARYRNDEVERLSAELFADFAPLDRQMAFSELTAAIRADMPYIGLYFQASTLVAENHVRIGARPNSWDPLGAMWLWYIVDY